MKKFESETIINKEQNIYIGSSEKLKLTLGTQEILVFKPEGSKKYIVIETKNNNSNLGEGLMYLEEGQEITLGRNSEIFDFDDSVSREHCRIAFNQGKIFVSDLGSTNGTEIEDLDFSQYNRDLEKDVIFEKKEENENLVDKQLAEFVRYVEDNKESILDKIKDNFPTYEKKHPELSVETINFFLLTDIIYDEFYSQGKSEFSDSNPKDKEKFLQYEENLKTIINLMVKREDYKDTFKAVESGNWIYLMVNSNEKLVETNTGNLGRIYLNVNPEVMTGIFNQLLSQGLKLQAKFHMKISTIGDSQTFSRSDKIVLYFKPEESDKIKSLIQEIYKKRESVFQDDLPKFTQPINLSDNKVMKGVSFGQEPEARTEAITSFGEIRSRILATVAKKILVGTNDKEYIKDKFEKSCIGFGVDPENPAFNNNSSAFNSFKTN